MIAYLLSQAERQAEPLSVGGWIMMILSIASVNLHSSTRLYPNHVRHIVGLGAQKTAGRLPARGQWKDYLHNVCSTILS